MCHRGGGMAKCCFICTYIYIRFKVVFVITCRCTAMEVEKKFYFRELDKSFTQRGRSDAKLVSAEAAAVYQPNMH